MKIPLPRCSMYGTFTYIYPKNCPNVGKYPIHGASGLCFILCPHEMPSHGNKSDLATKFWRIQQTYLGDSATHYIAFTGYTQTIIYITHIYIYIYVCMYLYVYTKIPLIHRHWFLVHEKIHEYSISHPPWKAITHPNIFPSRIHCLISMHIPWIFHDVPFDIPSKCHGKSSCSPCFSPEMPWNHHGSHVFGWL